MSSNNKSKGTKSAIKVKINISFNVEEKSYRKNQNDVLEEDRRDENKGNFSFELEGEEVKQAIGMAVEVLADKISEKFGSKKEEQEEDPDGEQAEMEEN